MKAKHLSRLLFLGSLFICQQTLAWDYIPPECNGSQWQPTYCTYYPDPYPAPPPTFYGYLPGLMLGGLIGATAGGWNYGWNNYGGTWNGNWNGTTNNVTNNVTTNNYNRNHQNKNLNPTNEQKAANKLHSDENNRANAEKHVDERHDLQRHPDVRREPIHRDQQFNRRAGGFHGGRGGRR